MRASFLILAALAGAAMLATLLYVRVGPASPAPPAITTAEAAAAAGPAEQAQPNTPAENTSPNTATPSQVSTEFTTPPTPNQQSHAAYVRTRKAQLQELSADDNPASLQTILSELTNRDPEIRNAAIEATIQFGSRDAIPKLMEAASQTEDPKEKQALVDAAEFLKLPSLTEVLQRKQGKVTITTTARPTTGPRPPSHFPSSKRVQTAP